MEQPVFGIGFQDNFTDDDDGRRHNAFARNHVTQVSQYRAHGTCIRPRGPFQYGYGRIGRQAIANKLFSDVCRSCHTHVDNQSAAFASKSSPILVGQALALTSDEGNGACGIAMGQRQHTGCCTAHRGGDAGNDLNIDASGTARFGFFAAASKNEWIAAF